MQVVDPAVPNDVPDSGDSMDEPVASSPPLVRIEHLSKTFPGQRALSDVSMEIRPNEIHALVGENGSGKSTLIKVLAGFHTPDPGALIEIDGEEYTTGSAAAARRHGLRFVHQDLGLIDQLSAADNVGIESGYRRGMARRIRWSAQQQHARDLVAKIGADVDVRRPVAELRPVDRSTIAIARALDDSEGAIRLLVLDEPTAALPPAEVDALFSVLREVVAAGVSILYVSHRLDEILGLADRVSVLRDGEFKGTRSARELNRTELVRLIVGDISSRQVEESQTAARARVAVTGERAFSFRGVTTERLHGIEVEVAAGEILGVAGLTGSGREEFAAAISGALPADLRACGPDGVERVGMSPRRAKSLGIALVLANRHPAAAVREFTVRENVTLPVLSRYRRYGRINRGDEVAAVLGRINEVDLRPPDPGRPYAFLSGGNRQKTIFAKWLNTSPGLLVLDDPTSGVDIGARHAIYDLVRGQTARGVSVVICSADLEDIVGVCDRVVALVGGRVSATLAGTQITEHALLDSILRASQDAPSDERPPGDG
jgi:ribose transport system ATP-binding protein